MYNQWRDSTSSMQYNLKDETGDKDQYHGTGSETTYEWQGNTMGDVLAE